MTGRGGSTSGRGLLPRVRRHLTYANVTATVALVLALGTGGAYAIDLVGSDGIRDNSVRSADLRDRRAVAGRDVKPNALGAKEVNERRLDVTQMVAVAHDTGTACAPPLALTDCAAATVRLRRPGTVLVTATGAFYGDGAGDSSAVCEVQLDGLGESVAQTPGESQPTTSISETDGFARTRVFSGVPAGPHVASLACRRLLGDPVIDTSTILALGLPGR